ncbi:aminodeoxychorismate lyase [Pseudomonas syringae pv. tagetis]|uniref:Aminodeoxychorismate lyase n=2 Tax=Pseudomonas syringae group genomosp. 7 TaxID=251699 RepID=A0A0Q0AQ81_9PSED|nr:aminodeoxychorismate lyase [Pseudomonas syringae group genomosp. 7]KPX48875.1 4-amino-4-deoxychorismate lyase [Pseudomonas syringae pv. helianthi]KPY80265.1 4-amino-4-deoxychorismate lyase [Pseudomonas syringae pv. tagetis]RMV49811.1 4-amino-4-deoxychorismate lyase [Pseudomonas syringae pv. helianthi]RMW18283.1 4-amino-4-deoxychorismate lyase [Pseudomonas syringae pv. tagetis]RMW24667.1 4-amino-4-deoxychorismate lyase [Pseudomonas syringae pv. tagetis]
MPGWVDGCPADALSLKNRGLAYGDGLFETIAVKAGQPVLLERHLQRLESGCQRLSIAADHTLLRAEMTHFAAELGDGVMKLILTRGDSQRGYAPALDTPSRRILQGGPAPVYPGAHAEQGVRLFDCRTRLAEQPLLAGLKHLNRLEQVLARSEWSDSEHAEGLMRDTSGRLIEGVYSNLFLISKGCLLTADLSRCGVAGVMRAELLDQARNLELAVDIRDLHMSDLESADEVFLCNSVYGVWPVCGFAASNWPVGPLTRKLQGIARTLLDI